MFFFFFALRLQSQSVQTSHHFYSNDEHRALREELEKYREAYESLRKSWQFNRREMHGDEREKLTTSSLDSGLDTNTVGMSSTFLSNSALQSELNESRQRERKLEENIQLLNKVREINRIIFFPLRIHRTCFRSNFNRQ